MKFKPTSSTSESSVLKPHNGMISKSNGRKKGKKLNGAVENLLKNESSSGFPSNPSSVQSRRKEKQKKLQKKSEIVHSRSLKTSSIGPSKRMKNKNQRKSNASASGGEGQTDIKSSSDKSGANGCNPIVTEAGVLSNRGSTPKKIERPFGEVLSVAKRKNKKNRGNFDLGSSKEGGNSVVKSSASGSVTDGSTAALAAFSGGSPKKSKKKRSKKKRIDGESEILNAVVPKISKKKTIQPGSEILGKEIVPEAKKIQGLKGQVERGSPNPYGKGANGVDGDQNHKQRREKFKNSKNSSLREKMLSRLSAARFRYINEELYTWDGQNAPEVFASDPKSFKAYHSGFKQQTKLWPINPIDVIIKSIKKVPGLEKKVIADFGCGEAKLALELSSNKVYSFDLIAINDRVTVCDNANTKLYSGSVDIAVHCLSLMSSNISGYIKEANRVLKIGGLLKIAEVESRFEDVEKFVENVCKFNFKLLKKDLSHNLFYFMDFEKVADIGVARKRKLPEVSLQPCLYKKR